MQEVIAMWLGIKWHKKITDGHGVTSCSCGRFNYPEGYCANPDFTTASGFELIREKMEKDGLWAKLYVWLAKKEASEGEKFTQEEIVFCAGVVGCIFHESTDYTTKAKQIAEAIIKGII